MEYSFVVHDFPTESETRPLGRAPLMANVSASTSLITVGVEPSDKDRFMDSYMRGVMEEIKEKLAKGEELGYKNLSDTSEDN